jgi:hypothetical protein
LAGFTELEYLRPSNARLYGDGLAHLKGLKHLKVLELASSEVRDKELRFLKDIHSLEKLVLPHGVRGQGMKYLVDLPYLRELDAHSSALSELALPYLAQMKSLRWINLSGTGIPREAVDRLRKMLPLAKIER